MSIDVIEHRAQTEINDIKTFDIIHIFFESHLILCHETAFLSELVSLITFLNVSLDDLLNIELEKEFTLFLLEQEIPVERCLDSLNNRIDRQLEGQIEIIGNMEEVSELILEILHCLV